MFTILSLILTGCGSAKSATGATGGNSQPTIKVGVIDSYTGGAAVYAKEALEGFKLAIAEAEAKGGPKIWTDRCRDYCPLHRLVLRCLRGVYFGMLTIALGQLVWAIIYRWNSLTGGDDGIHAIPIPEALSSPTVMYYVAFLAFTVCSLVLFVLIKSPFGLILKASRDNSIRAEGIGVNVRKHQLIAFVTSGFFAGVAGVLFILLERSVTPSMLYWNKSAEVLIMCLIGGIGTFLGPSLGAAILVLLSMVIGVYTDYWLLVLGSILLVLVLFLPQGILGLGMELLQKCTRWTAAGSKGGEK